MKEYNQPFFKLLENTFIILSENFKPDDSLKIFTKIMEKGLRSSYGEITKKGDVNNFIKLVGERDKNVGLQVEFSILNENQFLYRFISDPMPGLKEYVESKILDSTYMDFKVRHILGNEWSYSTNKHIWHGDKYTEHLISK